MTDFDQEWADVMAEREQSRDPDFWDARPVLRHCLDFARARRVGPWAMLGCVLVRVIAATPPKIVIPPLTGGPVSLNLFVGIVSISGGGKGTAEAASLDVIKIPHVPIVGAGSGEGIGHMFYAYNRKTGELDQHTRAVIVSAPEINTLTALKTRQASTLFPELHKVWMGEPLGFSYVDKEKRLNIPRHAYRLCLITGIQPANAGTILDGVDDGTPQRFLWLPANDLDAPDFRPAEPEPWYEWWTPQTHLTRAMDVCETARIEVEIARLDQLRGNGTGGLDGHALLGQLKIAAALAILDNRSTVINEDDWELAGMVRAISDQTRQQVINTVTRTKAVNNHVRAEAEAERAILIETRRDEHSIQRVGKSITRNLDKGDGWVAHSELRRALPSRDRGYFDDAIEALVISGQVEARSTQADHNGHVGTEYRRAR